jgi:hypothetical protein
MKTTMKKIAAYLLAVLLVFQVMPAFAATYSGTYTPSNTSLREALEIKAENDNTIIPVGTKTQLTISEDYKNPTWSSNNEDIATVDKKTGLVEAKKAGTVTITVKAEGYKDTITFRVIESTGTQVVSGNQGNDEKIIIVIKGDKTKVKYNGEEQKNTYSVSSNSELFDESKLIRNEENLGKGIDCGVYQDNLQAADFTYEGGDAEFVISNGWIQIKPASVIIKADDVTQKDGEEVQYTATVTGLVEGDSPDIIQYSFELFVSDDVTYISPVCETIQGNYKITKQPGILTLENGSVYRAIKLSSDWPEGEPAYAGTLITMTAEPIGF